MRSAARTAAGTVAAFLIGYAALMLVASPLGSRRPSAAISKESWTIHSQANPGELRLLAILRILNRKR